MRSTTSLPITNSGDDASQSWSTILLLKGENLIPNIVVLLLKVIIKLHFVSIFTKQNYIIRVFQVNKWISGMSDDERVISKSIPTIQSNKYRESGQPWRLLLEVTKFAVNSDSASSVRIEILYKVNVMLRHAFQWQTLTRNFMISGVKYRRSIKGYNYSRRSKIMSMFQNLKIMKIWSVCPHPGLKLACFS